MRQAGADSKPVRRAGWRAATVAGLVLSAAGTSVPWASGVVFPFYPPPGIVILCGGAVLAALALTCTIIQLAGASAALVAGLLALPRRSAVEQMVAA